MTNDITIKSMLPARITTLTPSKTYVGIDFGTSTTVVSFATYDNQNKTIKTIPIRLDQILEDGTRYSSEKIPSVIAYYNNNVLVGEGASNLKYKLKFGKDIWYSFKMELGEDLGAKYYESALANKEPFNICNPKDAARVFFMYLKLLIDRYCDNNGLSKNIDYAISIPASFEANQRKELMDALEYNGMTVTKQSLIDEPNAAFISYLKASVETEKPLKINPNYNPKVMVFDFGGGTCDISILEIGKSVNGLYSKNISISKFTKLGGDDIDRYLTYHYLLPRFMEYNNHKSSDFRTNERKFIASQLFKIAELLKIQICKSLALMTDDFVIPQIKNSESQTKIFMDIEVETSKGILKQSEFFITPAEMTKAMEIFLSTSSLSRTYKGEDDYNNIFMPIKSAIKKAKITTDELDYILLIGGSAQSPYIQEALANYFKESEILVPQDLQTHVSQGAAIHSLIMNGMNKCIIQPITSEPIFVITKDTNMKVLFPAGAQIPSNTIIIDDLVTFRDHQEQIELPICVGNQNKMLHNLIITSPESNGFPINTPIKLVLEINADKLLLAQASCSGISCEVSSSNPFANKELTTEDRIVLMAERQANIDAQKNNGTPTKRSLIALKEAYEKAGNSFKAAETMELQTELYPNPDDYNEIGVLYSNAGNSDKAIEFYERAYDIDPNCEYVNFNLGHSLKYIDSKRYKEHINKALKINPNHNPSLIESARIEKKEGHVDSAKIKFKKAYDNLMRKWKSNSMSNSDYSWLSAAAEELDHSDIAYEVRQSKPTLKQEIYFNEDNLTKTQLKQLK